MGFLEDVGLVLPTIEQMVDRIISGKFSNDYEAELAMRFYLSKKYNMPIFHEYFEKRTAPELLFETALHRALDKPVGQRTSEQAKQLTEDDNDVLFGDMMREDGVGQDATSLAESDPEFMKMAEEFKKTGKFKGESV